MTAILNLDDRAMSLDVGEGVTNQPIIHLAFNHFQQQFGIPQLAPYPHIESLEEFEPTAWERVFITGDVAAAICSFYERCFRSPEWHVARTNSPDHRTWVSPIRANYNTVVLQCEAIGTRTLVSLRIWTTICPVYMIWR